MNQLLYKMVERMLLHPNSFSRNKNFEAFEEPRLRKATRIVRHLRSIQRDLKTHGARAEVAVTPPEALPARPADPDDPSRVQVRLTIAHLKSRREAYLSPEELRLLCLDDEVARLLQGAVADLPAADPARGDLGT